MDSYSQETPWECELCHIWFKKYWNLKNHRKSLKHNSMLGHTLKNNVDDSVTTTYRVVKEAKDNDDPLTDEEYQIIIKELIRLKKMST